MRIQNGAGAQYIIRREFMNKLSNLVNTIKNHRAVNNGFYDRWMTELFSIEEVGIFARNYWELNYRFPEALAALISNIDNIVARVEYTKTLFSETGNGCVNKSHSILFEDFCSNLSKVMGNESYLKIDNLKNTTHLLPETLKLISEQKKLYSNNKYAIAAGAQLALEWQAYTMIMQLYEGARNYKHLWSDQNDFHEACEFFHVHLGEAEKAHKIESIKVTEKVIEEGGSYEDVEYGFKKHLDLIADFWEAISKNMTG
jgi:pyrroloquinoline quinone (PQQ) biosynthesis protein C